jgi:hypothetical protein
VTDVLPMETTVTQLQAQALNSKCERSDEYELSVIFMLCLNCSWLSPLHDGSSLEGLELTLAARGVLPGIVCLYQSASVLSVKTIYIQ